MKHEELGGFQAPFEIAPVKKFARERAGVVLDEKMIDGVAAAHAANSLAASDADAQREDIVGAHIFDMRKVETIFVTEREISEKIFERVDAAFCEKFGSLMPYPFEHLDIDVPDV